VISTQDTTLFSQKIDIFLNRLTRGEGAFFYHLNNVKNGAPLPSFWVGPPREGAVSGGFAGSAQDI
jgi:hypothetical protein